MQPSKQRHRDRMPFRWYARLLGAFVRLSLQSQMEYRLNFAACVSVELGYMLIKLLYLVVVIHTGVQIGPLTPEMVTVFVGTYIFMTGVWMLLEGVNDIPRRVIYGEMDLLLTKPGSLQFLQTFGQFNFGLALPNVTVGLVLTVVGWNAAGIPVDIFRIAGFIFYLVMGILMTYSFVLIPALLVFWTTSLSGIKSLLEATWDFNNMPMLLYHKVVQAIGTFVLPIFLLTNWPGMFALELLTPLQAVWGILLPFLLLAASRQMWKRAFLRYQSGGG